MSSIYKNIIFDLDGTLLDPKVGVINSVKFTTRSLGLPDIPEPVIVSFIGPPIRNSLQQYFNLDDLQADAAESIFRSRYKDVDLFFATVYNGIYDMLTVLSNNQICLSVATYKREDYAVQLLEYFNLASFFSHIHGSDNKTKKTKSEIIKHCLKDIRSKNDDAIILVGDTRHDAEGAKEMNIEFVGVTYGYGFKSEEDFFDLPYLEAASNVDGLKEILLKWCCE